MFTSLIYNKNMNKKNFNYKNVNLFTKNIIIIFLLLFLPLFLFLNTSNLSNNTTLKNDNNEPKAGDMKDFFVGYHSAKIINDGVNDHLYVWGENHNGELGTGDKIDRKTPVEIPIGDDLGDNKVIKQLSLGNEFSAAVLNDEQGDHLYTWGSNYFGQLGNGNTLYIPIQWDPTEISIGDDLEGTKTIKEIELGGSTSSTAFAVVNDGTDDHLYTWGNNSDGQLGNGSTRNEDVPTEISIGDELGGTKTIKQVAVSQTHSSAIINDGKNDHLYMWGTNGMGQLGTGGSKELVTTPTEISIGDELDGTKTIKEVSLGVSFSSAVVNDGTNDHLYMWGSNDASKLGLGDSNSRDKPTEASIGDDLGETKIIKQVSLGSRYSGAILNDGTNDHLYTWGSNDHGELGTGNEASASENTPVEISIGDDLIPTTKTIKEISFSTSFSSAIVNDGTNDHNYVWGQNGKADLGLGDNEDKYTPVELSSPKAWIGNPTNINQTDDGGIFDIEIKDGIGLGVVTGSDLSIDSGSIKVADDEDLAIGDNSIIVSDLSFNETVIITIKLNSLLGDVVKNIKIELFPEVSSLDDAKVVENSTTFDSTKIQVNVGDYSKGNNIERVKTYDLIVTNPSTGKIWENDDLSESGQQIIEINDLEIDTIYKLEVQIKGTEIKTNVDAFSTDDLPLKVKKNSFIVDNDSISKDSFVFSVSVDENSSLNRGNFDPNSLLFFSNNKELKIDFISFEENKYSYKTTELEHNTKYDEFTFSFHSDGTWKETIDDEKGESVIVTTKKSFIMAYVYLGLTLFIIIFIIAIISMIFTWKKRRGEDNYGSQNNYASQNKSLNNFNKKKSKKSKSNSFYFNYS